MDISDPPALPKIGSLDLSTVRGDREKNKMGMAGEQSLETGEILMSPRATTDQVLMTPRTAMGKKDTKRVQFTSAPELHGEGPVAIASNGEVHASIGVNGKLALWDAASSKLLCQVTLQLPADLEKKQDTKRKAELEAKPPKWLSFDCAGSSLGIHRPGIGLWLCRVKKTPERMEVTDALMLGDGKMSEKFTWVGFSSVVPGLLAVGTDSGRVMLFSPKTNKLTAQKDGKVCPEPPHISCRNLLLERLALPLSGRSSRGVSTPRFAGWLRRSQSPAFLHPSSQHPGKAVAIVAGDWLKDGRLAVASHERMKVSAPISVDAAEPEWKTYAKFYINKMVSKIPIAQASASPRPFLTPTIPLTDPSSHIPLHRPLISHTPPPTLPLAYPSHRPLLSHTPDLIPLRAGSQTPLTHGPRGANAVCPADRRAAVR